MMKVTIHQLTRAFYLMLFPMLMAACQLHEEPELTPDGEWGVDPTEVNIDLNVQLTLSLPDQGEEEEAVGVLRVPSTNEYLRRFIVEAYLNRQPVARQVFVENSYVEEYRKKIDHIFGKDSCHVLKVRQLGGIKVI